VSTYYVRPVGTLKIKLQQPLGRTGGTWLLLADEKKGGGKTVRDLSGQEEGTGWIWGGASHATKGNHTGTRPSEKAKTETARKSPNHGDSGGERGAV